MTDGTASPSSSGEPTGLAREVVAQVGSGVGRIFVAPMVAATLESADVQRAARARAIEVALILGGGIAAGIIVGSWLRRR